MSEERVEYKTVRPMVLSDDIVSQIEQAVLRVLAHGWGDVQIKVSNHRVDIISTSVSNKIVD